MNIKKIWSILLCVFCVWFAFGNTVPANQAQLVAGNFIRQHAGLTETNLKLMHAATSANGTAFYYVFDLNNAHGFVIVSAEDAGKPIIGYSTSEKFVVPAKGSNLEKWLSKRAEEIDYLRNNNTNATENIKQSWFNYTNDLQSQQKAAVGTTVAPLIETLWKQSPFYNDDCPGGSVTGCVATAMAQIMKFWSFPKHGTGSSSYNENDYGSLSANYGNATYNFDNMPNSISGPNADIALLMSHCGISVNMDYSPAGSGAWVICSDNPISAQHSYTAYFGYDPNEILGVRRSDYSDAAWTGMIKHDLEIGRPMQYVGFGNDGGHTWVLDGVNDVDFYHMNWGWGGSGNGWFDIDALNPNGMDFSQGQQAIFGIVPKATIPVDAGVLSITPNEIICGSPFINPVLKVRNFGVNTLFSCALNYQIDGGSMQTINWNGSIVTGQTTSVSITGNAFGPGTHTITCYTSNPNNLADGDLSNDMKYANIVLTTIGMLPASEGFEAANYNDHWSILNSNGSNWQINTQSSSGGARSMMIDNLNNTPGNMSILQGINDFDLTTYTTYPVVSFKVAYQQKTATSSDILRLQVSEDCGKTWRNRWTKQGAALASTTATSNVPFVPTQNEFKTYTVALPYYYSAIFRFAFTADGSDPGNNIYLDDVNLFDPSASTDIGVRENSAIEDAALNLYPNPTKDKVTIAYSAKDALTFAVNVYDMMGKKVLSVDKGKMDAGMQLIDLTTSELKPGVYMVNISMGNDHLVKRLVIQN